MVGLSGLDSKKCQSIIQYKHHLNIPERESYKSTILDDALSSNMEIDEYGETVVKYLREKRKEFSQEEIEMMASLYQTQEKTTIELAEQFGCSKTTISKLLKAHGVHVTKEKAQAKLNVGEVITLYEQQHTSEEIARRFKVNPQVILKCLKSHGVKIRSRWDYYNQP